MDRVSGIVRVDLTDLGSRVKHVTCTRCAGTLDYMTDFRVPRVFSGMITLSPVFRNHPHVKVSSETKTMCLLYHRHITLI